MKTAKNFFFCFSPNSGAWIMAFTNLTFAILLVGSSSIRLFYLHSDEDNLNFIMGIIMGLFNLITGVVLIVAIVKAKERIVLLYILLELINLMIITIFSVFYMFRYESFILAGLFVICLLLWFGLYCMVTFYFELAEYNSVKSGAIEITCNTHINPLMGLPEKAIESTAV